MQSRVGKSFQDIPAGDWNALLRDNNPFLRHEFLLALEQTGCATVETGWQPCPVMLYSGNTEQSPGKLLAAMPLYRKMNSHGEFVFDFAWANAYHQYGHQYYPKLVAAIPFTPATGPRMLVHPEAENPDQLRNELIAAALQLAEDNECSSLHILFADDDEAKLAESSGLMPRRDCQFHWHNQDYQDFDEFLSTFSSSKRKKTRRDRRRMEEQAVRFETRYGDELSAADWDAIFPLYRTTFIRRGREPYLNKEFFERICTVMPRQLLTVLGYQNEELVAVSICFRSDDTLYGRYWGANKFIDSLHFETCYYQGIDYCIKNGLQHFEPGTQGEHKISRGFVPALTWSAHWLAQPQFAEAVDDYLKRESSHIDEYVDSVWEHVPYRNPDN